MHGAKECARNRTPPEKNLRASERQIQLGDLDMGYRRRSLSLKA